MAWPNVGTLSFLGRYEENVTELGKILQMHAFDLYFLHLSLILLLCMYCLSFCEHLQRAAAGEVLTAYRAAPYGALWHTQVSIDSSFLTKQPRRKSPCAVPCKPRQLSLPVGLG